MKQLLRLRPFLRAYWWQILLSLIFLLCLTGLSLVIPAIIRQVIDVGLSQGDVTLLIQAAAIILVIGITRAILIYFQRYLSEWVAQHIAYDLRNQLYDHIQNLPFSFHDHSQTGQLISRCIEDVRSIQAFTGSSLVELVRLSLLLAGTLYLLFSQNARLAAIALLPLIPLALMTTSFGKRITGLFWAVDNALGELSSRLQENVLGAQVVRAFAREPFEIQRFDQTNRALFDARIKVNSEWSRILSSSNFLVTLGTILILWFGGQMVLAGQMTVGELVAFNSYLLILAGPVQQLTWVVNSAGEAIAGVQRTYEILDRQPEIQSPKEAVVTAASLGAG